MRPNWDKYKLIIGYQPGPILSKFRRKKFAFTLKVFFFGKLKSKYIYVFFLPLGFASLICFITNLCF